MTWDTIYVLVPFTRVPRRIMTGRLVNLLTFFALHIQQKLNRSFAERIWDITYPISSSPYYSEDIHTKITPRANLDYKS